MKAETITQYADGTEKSFKKREASKQSGLDSVSQAADDAVSQVGLSVDPSDPNFEKYREAFDAMLIDRTITQISHNKFMVLLKDGKPIEVWTGSTNYTEGGIFGQSYVGHIGRDPVLAKEYLAYWTKLSTDPK